jgi:hypothetical protein
MRMPGHVAGGEKGHQKADAGDNQAEQETQTVKAEAQYNVEAGHPGPFNDVDPTLHHLGQTVHNPTNSRSGRAVEKRPHGCSRQRGMNDPVVAWPCYWDRKSGRSADLMVSSTVSPSSFLINVLCTLLPITIRSASTSRAKGSRSVIAPGRQSYRFALRTRGPGRNPLHL